MPWRVQFCRVCRTWSLRVEDVHGLEVFDHRCLHSTAEIEWSNCVSIVKVRNLVPAIGSKNIIRAGRA